ncbi:serine protease [Caulobacter sp. BE254]|uniref:trypsin-like serine peptidase n=1 Tax=Caulobacter sp. BE254 TaxID=2817720 RepID=UPI0028600F05|nr:serine protease [Caulobacter sp. BE254]MDR7117615.1 hypothetical protein [Caulobacter sp. BE254]
MILNPPETGIFLRAMQRSLDWVSLSNILLWNFGLNLGNIANRNGTLEEQVLQTYQRFAMLNEVERLVAVLRDARPSVPDFAHVADRMGFTQLPVEGLEALVRPAGTPFQDVDFFRATLSMRERAVCQVVGSLTGTGTLIAPGYVLTNEHVVTRDLAADGSLTGAVVCVFDKKKGPNGYVTPETRVAVKRVLATSTHAPTDESPGPLTEASDALDYALLELERKIDEEAVAAGGDPRGFVKLSDAAPVPQVADGLIVLQHPDDLPMKIDLGSVKQVGETRLRHSVNTMKGSSGAPVFDAGLNMVAVHHAGHLDWPPATLGYNQAIPIGVILASLRAKGVTI